MPGNCEIESAIWNRKRLFEFARPKFVPCVFEGAAGQDAYGILVSTQSAEQRSVPTVFTSNGGLMFLMT